MSCEEEAKRYEYVAVADMDEELIDTLLAQGWDEFSHVFLMTPGRPDPRSEDHSFLHILWRERDEPRKWARRELLELIDARSYTRNP